MTVVRVAPRMRIHADKFIANRFGRSRTFAAKYFASRPKGYTVAAQEIGIMLRHLDLYEMTGNLNHLAVATRAHQSLPPYARLFADGMIEVVD